MIEMACHCESLPAHVHRHLSWIERGDDGRRFWIPGFIPQDGYRVIAEVEELHVSVDWKALYRHKAEGFGICMLCETQPATTVWGFPVCQSCADTLTEVDQELKAMEAEDPELAEAAQRAEDALHLMAGCCETGPDVCPKAES